MSSSANSMSGWKIPVHRSPRWNQLWTVVPYGVWVSRRKIPNTIAQSIRTRFRDLIFSGFFFFLLMFWLVIWCILSSIRLQNGFAVTVSGWADEFITGSLMEKLPPCAVFVTLMGVPSPIYEAIRNNNYNLYIKLYVTTTYILYIKLYVITTIAYIYTVD